MIDLSGRVALVTGGSRGIGWACAEALARVGAAVAITWRAAEEVAQEAVQLLRDGGTTADAFRLDLADAAAIGPVVDRVLEKFGRIDILVNNAGIWNARHDALVDLGDDALDRMLATNLRGTMLVTRAVARDMLRRDFGRVVSVGSTAGIRGEPGHCHYAASKGALLAWSRSLVGELSPHGITVNVVSPGWVFTDMTKEALTPERVHRIEAEIPTRRISRPDDVAAAVVFLASPYAAQVNGVNLDVNGGAVFS